MNNVPDENLVYRTVLDLKLLLNNMVSNQRVNFGSNSELAARAQVKYLNIQVATLLALEVLCCRKHKNLALGVLRVESQTTTCRLLLKDSLSNIS